MIIDPRAGSGDLAVPLAAAGVDVKVRTLKYGDAYILGEGPDGRPARVGIEVKTITDFMSSMMGGRFPEHQMPGLLNTYEWVVVLIEGRDAKSEDGDLLVHHRWGGPVRPKGTDFRHSAFLKMQMTLQFKERIHVDRTEDRAATVDYLVSLNKWWLDGYDSHHSHRSVKYHGDGRAAARIARAGRVRKVAAQIENLGYVRSGAIAQEFDTVEQMVAAPASRWAGIQVRIHGGKLQRLGAVAGEFIYRWFREKG